MKGSEFDQFNRTKDRILSVEEAQAYLDLPVTTVEREDMLALVQWFRRRYATPLERLAYARQAYARWARARGRSGGG